MQNQDLKEVAASRDVVMVEDNIIPDKHTISAKFTEAEHNLGTRQALRTYKKAVFWALFFGLSVIMWGYDAQIGGGLLASPQFRKDFGYVSKNGQYILPADWQAAFNSASSIGGFFGGITCGYVSDRYGRCKTLGLACVVSIGAVFIQFFADSNGLLLTGKIINGLCLGFFQTIAPNYCSEVVPLVLRGAVTSGVNLFIALGQLLANGLINGFGGRNDHFAYKAPFALQWLFPTILLAGLPFCPESPWYLVRRGKIEEARTMLHRLAASDADIEGTLSNISETIQLEDNISSGGSYLQCFRGVDRRRTLIAIGCFAVTQVIGVSFVLGYSGYFFQLAGIAVSDSFKLSMGVSTLGILGNIASWFVCNSIGRRRIFLMGTIILTVILILIAILDIIPNYNSGEQWGQAVLTVIYNFFYFMFVGGMAYIIFAEVSSTKLRSRTIGITITFTNILGTVINVIIPYMLNPTNGNWRGKTGFFFGGWGVLCIIWTYFCLPETRNKTFEELDLAFYHKLSAREFGEFVVPIDDVREQI